MNKIGLFALLSALETTNKVFMISERTPTVIIEEIKKCVFCGKFHRGNNCFCSVECCKSYKKDKKNKKK